MRGRDSTAPRGPLLSLAPTTTSGLPFYVYISHSSNHPQSAADGEGASILATSSATSFPGIKKAEIDVTARALGCKGTRENPAGRPGLSTARGALRARPEGHGEQSLQRGRRRCRLRKTLWEPRRCVVALVAFIFKF